MKQYYRFATTADPTTAALRAALDEATHAIEQHGANPRTIRFDGILPRLNEPGYTWTLSYNES